MKIKTLNVNFEWHEQGWICKIIFKIHKNNNCFCAQCLKVLQVESYYYKWWFSAWWATRQSMWMMVDVESIRSPRKNNETH